MTTAKAMSLRQPPSGRTSRGFRRAIASIARFSNRYIEPFAPDLVVTDFEPFSAWWAWRHRVPFISIDNEHLLILCKLDHRLSDLFGRLSAAVVVRGHYFGARAYIVTSFFKPRQCKGAILAPPIVRPAIARLQPSDAGHIVVYATTGTQEEQWRDVLGGLAPQKFHIYGFNKNVEWKNCVFKETSAEGFATDLASAKGVIASAGYSLDQRVPPPAQEDAPAALGGTIRAAPQRSLCGEAGLGHLVEAGGRAGGVAFSGPAWRAPAAGRTDLMAGQRPVFRYPPDGAVEARHAECALPSEAVQQEVLAVPFVIGPTSLWLASCGRRSRLGRRAG